MNQAKNILFVMCDQLRWDYLSCYGHPHLHTPNIDWLAENGVRFDRAYIQSPVCGPSRACIYTGRYQTTLGVRHNGYPLRIDELGLGDYLQPLNMRTAVCGKSDLSRHTESAQRLGIDLSTQANSLIREVGFEAFDRDSGNHPTKLMQRQGQKLKYNKYLQSVGYEGENPWHEYANSSVDEEGKVCDGWYNRNAKYPANIKEQHSETAYMTNRAIEFIEEAGDEPWCLHLSYIKPHWPYIAPAPYHKMYTSEQVLPANRTPEEREHPHHPVYAGFLNYSQGEGFVRDEVRETVIPTYMGLIKQIDDQLGRLLQWMRDAKRDILDKTMIIFTSDHGDYLGDHWFVDKYWFHEEIIRVPLIIYDPESSADSTRGTVCEELVESIDIVPTCIEFAGGEPDPQRLEGRSLMPFMRGETPTNWRDFVICEEDYSPLTVRHHLDLPINEARATMIRTARWKYILHEAFRAELYDMQNDPQERHDLGDDPAYQEVRQALHERLFGWFRHRALRFTRADSFTMKRSEPGWVEETLGVMIGHW